MIDPGHVPVEPSRSALRDSYLARHWRGELSLPVSYFVNGVLLGAICFVVITALSPLIENLGSPLGVLLAIVGVWLLVLVVGLWQAVGIWRSAGVHPSRGGSKGWAIVAKIMVIIGLLQTANIVRTSAIPQIREGIEIVRGDPSVGAHTIRVINNGTEVEIAGGITVGLANELDDVLAANPGVRTVHLNSNGGRIVEARNIRDLIERYDLDTYVASECLSACTVAYLGGNRRFIDSDARLGFHAGTYPGLSTDDTELFDQVLVEAAIDRGVTQAFAEKAYLTDSGEIWAPENQELIAAGFVTELANGQFGVSGFGVNFTREDVASNLRMASMFDMVADVDPLLFAEITEVFYNAALVGTPLGEISARTRSMLVNLLVKYASFASNELLFEMIGLLIDELRILEVKDSEACFSYLYPALGGPIDLRNYLPTELWQRDLEMTERIIASGVANEAQSALPGDARKAFDESLARIIEQHGGEMLADVMALSTDLTGLDKATVCRTVRIIYESLLEEEPNDAAALMRELLASAPEL